MKPGTPFLVPHQWEETTSCLSEPLDDGRRFSIGDRRVNASVDDEIRVRLVSCRIERGEIHLRGLCHLFIGIMEYVDVIGKALPVFVEYQAPCQVTRI